LVVDKNSKSLQLQSAKLYDLKGELAGLLHNLGHNLILYQSSNAQKKVFTPTTKYR